MTDLEKKIYEGIVEKRENELKTAKIRLQIAEENLNKIKEKGSISVNEEVFGSMFKYSLDVNKTIENYIRYECGEIVGLSDLLEEDFPFWKLQLQGWTKQ